MRLNAAYLAKGSHPAVSIGALSIGRVSHLSPRACLKTPNSRAKSNPPFVGAAREFPVLQSCPGSLERAADRAL
jgi:hypothetical protein